MTHVDILRKHIKSPEAIAAYVNEALRNESVEYAQLALRQLNEAKGCNLPTRKNEVRILVDIMRKSNFSLQPPSKIPAVRRSLLHPPLRRVSRIAA
jgi:DNA-binding phage protein